MKSFLLFGFLIGLRHALEADHLAAVASMTRGERSWLSTILRGATWGVGHTLTLLLVGGGCLLLGASVPAPLGRAFEAIVGVMLVALGAQVLWRWRRQRIHVHVHRHADGEVHLHAHSHADERPHDDPAAHDHRHPERFEGRALAVGLVHGLAGSAALVLLTLEATGGEAGGGVWIGLAYIALFGLGSIVGMAALSAVIAGPLKLSGRVAAGMMNGLEGTIGAATVVLGVWVLIRQAGLG